MAPHRAVPRISLPAIVRGLTDQMPAAVVHPSGDSSVIVEGSSGAYTVALTTEARDEWEIASVDVTLTQPPGFDEPLPPGEAITIPHGVHSLTSDFGQRLRVDHSALVEATVRIVKDFEAQSPTLSAGATT